MEKGVLLSNARSLLAQSIVEEGLPEAFATRSNIFRSLLLGTPAADSLSGTENRDFIFGLDGDDLIEGLGGDDFAFGGAGNNTIRGGAGSDRIFSGAGVDQLFGDAGNDRFRDLSGGNTIDGGEGVDSINYRAAEAPIELRFDVEVTDNADGFSVPVTGVGRLQVAQPGLEIDNIASIERVMGPRDRANTIDFSESYWPVVIPGFGPVASPVTSPAINVDLGQNRLSIDSTAVSSKIAIENFQNVVGSFGDDTIVGDDGSNRLSGYLGADVIDGKGGDDFLSTYEDDTLIGGAGRDTFELAAASKFVAPRGGSGTSRPSVIVDFEPGVDTIQLNTEDSIAPSGLGQVTFYRGFTGLFSTGELLPEKFRFLGSTEPTFIRPFIVYDPATGDLFYSDGNNPSPSEQIATLQGAPNISASDFIVV